MDEQKTEQPPEPKIETQTDPETKIEDNEAPKTSPEEETSSTEETQEDASKEEKKKKSKKPLIICLVAFFVLALGGASWYFFFRNRTPETISEDQKPSEPIREELAPIDASKLALRGNSLSDFDLAFLRLENTQENAIYSPLSIKYALAMLADGANGDSKTQITNLIGDYSPKAYLNSEHRSLANAMFIKDNFTENVLASYKDSVSAKYNASLFLDPLTSASNINNWVSDQTLGIINNLLNDNQILLSRFVLVNALAIDMNWQNRIQCAYRDDAFLPCISYSIHYPHTKYSSSVGFYEQSEGQERDFGDKTVKYETVRLGATSNHYNILETIGEDEIRRTVQAAYDEWLAYVDARPEEYFDTTFDLEEYVSELGNAGFGDHKFSTDFYFNDTDSEKVFAKDLKEYDGSTFQFVAIMPKSESLSVYLDQLTAEKASSLISDLKDVSDYNNFKDGVVTKITGEFPLFKFGGSLNLVADLQQLGINDIFSERDADLSNLIEENEETEGIYITDAIHKADIEFSNDGIKAAAATALVGGMGAAGPGRFYYDWELPVEEIDLTFDNPFLFLIRDKSTGEVWFTGAVYEPGNH